MVAWAVGFRPRKSASEIRFQNNLPELTEVEPAELMGHGIVPTVVSMEDISNPPTVRAGTPADLSGVVEVLSLGFDSFPPWPVSEGPTGFVRWMTEPTGSSQVNGAVVSELEGRIVGANVRSYRPALVHHQRVIATTGPWVAMHPDARGKGFYRALRFFDPLGADVGYGFSQVAEIQHLRKEQDTASVANPWSVYVCVQRPLPAALSQPQLRRWTRLPGYIWLALRGRVQRRLPRRHRENHGLTVSSVPVCDERFDALFESAADDFDFILERDHRYLNWRYLDRRGGTFSVLAAESGDQLLGYAAVTVVDGRGHIADLLVLPGREDVTRALVEASLEHCAQLGSSAVECTMMMHHPYTRTLREAGFVRRPGRSDEATNRFGLRRDTVDREIMRDFRDNQRSRIHLAEGDSELI